MQVKEVPKDVSLQLINEVFDKLRKITDHEAFFVSNSEHEIGEQSLFADEQIGRLENLEYHKNLLLTIDRQINEELASKGINVADVSVHERETLREGLQRALIEQQRLFKFRLRERLLPYEPLDRLFSSDVNFTQVTSPTANLSPDLSEIMTLGSAVNKYVSARKSGWTEKTYKDFSRQLNFLVQFFGPDKPLGEIDAQSIRTFRDKVQGLHKNHVNMPGESISDTQAIKDADRISFATASKIFGRCKSVFAWATDHQGYLETNPAEKISLLLNYKKKTTGRKPWPKVQLEELFTSPLYLGFHSKNRRYLIGKQMHKDAQYWLPLLAYYTGARLGEIVQLHHKDVSIDHQIPHIHVTEDGSGPLGSETYKHVKSNAAERLIPIHPDLIELGFLKFLKSRRRRKAIRVFPEVSFGKDGQASTVFSKWFGRYRKKIGITDPLVVFHSFRHSAEDAFRNATQPQYVIDAIIGHYDGKTSSGYGEGIDLERRYEAICKMALPVRVPVLWNALNEGGE
ncbi:MAG: site-specific integrase [Parasphingorhabdus sp.]